MQTMTTPILLSSTPTSLAKALGQYARTATVEAEYGDVVIDGTVLTLAHHGPRRTNPCPCLHEHSMFVDAVGLSHVDLDAIGGTLAILGKKPEGRAFWRLAAAVDVQGAHHLDDIDAPRHARESLHAWWAWAQRNRCYPSRDGSVTDVADYIERARDTLSRILDEDDAELLNAGWEMREAEAELANVSFVGASRLGRVIKRISGQFVNHLYRAPEGQLAQAVVALNTDTGAVTVSLSDPIPGVSCRDVVQGLWGALAGGHDGIAGSPRGDVMQISDLERAFAAMCAALKEP